MNHSSVLELIPRYLRGGLDGAELQEFENHLAQCPSCSTELQEWREIRFAANSLAESVPPPASDLLRRTLARVHASDAAPVRPRRRLASLFDWLWRPAPRFATTRLAYGLQALILLLAIFLVRSNWTGWSTATAPRDGQPEMAEFVLVLKPRATGREVLDALAIARATVVLRGSPDGTYVIRVAKDDVAFLESAWLAQYTAIVESLKRRSPER